MGHAQFMYTLYFYRYTLVGGILTTLFSRSMGRCDVWDLFYYGDVAKFGAIRGSAL